MLPPAKVTEPQGTGQELAASWYRVAESREVKPGTVRSVGLAGRTFALWRDAQGKLTLLHNRCCHFGGDLSKGRVVDDRLQCPFHGWQYDASGACVNVPYSPAVPKCAVAQVPVTEYAGFIFGWHAGVHQASPDFEPTELLAFSREQYYDWTIGMHSLPLRSDLLLANVADPAHLPFVHGIRSQVHRHSCEGQRFHIDTTFPLSRAKLPWKLPVYYSVDFRATNIGVGIGVLEVSMQLYPFRRRVELAVLVLPNQRGRYTDGIMAVALKRGQSLLVSVFHRLIQRVAHIIIFEELREDIPVLSAVEPPEQPMWVKGDEILRDYHRWSRQFYG